MTWGKTELKGWLHLGIPLENGLKEIKNRSPDYNSYATRGKLLNGPVGYESNFDITKDDDGPIYDTFLNMSGWGKVSIKFQKNIYQKYLKLILDAFSLIEMIRSK